MHSLCGTANRETTTFSVGGRHRRLQQWFVLVTFLNRQAQSPWWNGNVEVALLSHARRRNRVLPHSFEDIVAVEKRDVLVFDDCAGNFARRK